MFVDLCKIPFSLNYSSQVIDSDHVFTLISFLVTTFLSKRTPLRDLRRSSFAESLMQSMQYLFNKGFSFSESHLALFLPSSNGEQQL